MWWPRLCVLHIIIAILLPTELKGLVSCKVHHYVQLKEVYELLCPVISFVMYLLCCVYLERVWNTTCIAAYYYRTYAYTCIILYR